MGPAAMPELKWERTEPGASPRLAFSPGTSIALYPEAISSRAKKEAGHSTGSCLVSLKQVEAGAASGLLQHQAEDQCSPVCQLSVSACV